MGIEPTSSCLQDKRSSITAPDPTQAERFELSFPTENAISTRAASTKLAHACKITDTKHPHDVVGSNVLDSKREADNTELSRFVIVK